MLPLGCVAALNPGIACVRYNAISEFATASPPSGSQLPRHRTTLALNRCQSGSAQATISVASACPTTPTAKSICPCPVRSISSPV
ncbi:hypothetical protein C3E98_004955 [Pseudomonas sp. MWU13-2625]|nr:hypothetical protein C3E98_004955 [Pseudomonas sp. MWU13-2625]